MVVMKTIPKATRLATERVPIGAIHPDPANVRVHDAKNLKVIMDSLTRFGQQRPLLVDLKGTIVAGNGTYEAAVGLGWKEIAIVRTGLKGDEARAYALVDNRATDLSWFDDEGLAASLKALADAGTDIASLGWSAADLTGALAALGGCEGLTDPDEVPEPPEEPITKPGDLWSLGAHRLLCGDATTAGAYDRVLAAQQAALIVTDPPYGVGIASKNAALNATGHGSSRVDDQMQGDSQSAERAAESLWGPAFVQMFRVVAPGAALYCFAPQGGDQMMMMMMIKAHFHPSMHQIIWRKNTPTFSLGRIDYAYAHEPIIYTWKESGRAFYGEGQTSVIECPRPARSDTHATMKPVQLLAQLIGNSSKVGQVVLDPFAGSGSTLIAAEETGRVAALIEIEPHYCDVIVRRWETFTGKKAVRQ